MMRGLLTVIGVSLGLPLAATADVQVKPAQVPAAVLSKKPATSLKPAPNVRPPAPTKHTSTGLVNLGRLDKPGARLAQKRFDLVPGGTLRFATSESAVRGLGQIQAPKGAVLIRRTVLKAPKPGLAGGSLDVEYRFTLPVNAKPGVYKVSTGGAFQVRKDTAWAFSFELHVGKRRIGEPRPL